jgi:hypothetical protein
MVAGDSSFVLFGWCRELAKCIAALVRGSISQTLAGAALPSQKIGANTA